MLKYIVGGVVIVLAWVLVILLDLEYLFAIGITLLVVLVVLLLLGIEKLRERRAARELEKAIAAQAAQQAASARPDLQHEIAEMQAEFGKAVGALKTSKKGGKKALYALPWYTIIGPPGCGKSTALRNSGLQFPYLSASGGGVRGLGGTRNCDWWMTSEAVILDTAGRWTSEDEDRDEWLGFLDLIKRFRPKKPLNGIIAAVSVGDVGGAREDEVVNLARRIRERIDEVQGRLQMSLPIYVLFTKCDLIPGFVETFGDMSKEDRSQVWGFTAPLSKPVGPAGEYFARGFDQLVGILEYRALKRMGEDRKVQNREMIYAFPQQLAVLRNNLAEFVHHLFLENVFKETPRVRGVYFTSGTQEGRPIDRVMSKMAEAFGQQQVQLPAAQVESKSYFLRDTFAKIVFMDANVAMRSPDEVARQRRNAFAASGAIFFLALCIVLFPILSWSKNRTFLTNTQRIVDLALQANAGAPPAAPVHPRVIQPLRARLLMLERYDGVGRPFLMRFGMYQSEVYEPVREAYLSVLRRRVIAPIVNADVNEMDAFGRRHEAGSIPDAQDMRLSYNRLKLHLLITLPKGEHEPERNDDLEDFMQGQLAQRWVAATGVRRSDPGWAQIEGSTEYYVEALDDRRDLHFTRSETTVTRVRGVFEAVGGYDMAVEGIVENVRPYGSDMSLARLIGGGVSELRARERVRFAFTRDAWRSRVRNMLENEAPRFFGEHWVLGQPPPANPRQAELQRQAQVEGLRSYFLSRYAQEWSRFIEGLFYGPQTQPLETKRLLDQLTSGEPMRLTMLVRQIALEVDLRERRPQQANAGNPTLDAARQRAAQQGQRVFGQHSQRVINAAEGEARRRLAGPGAPPDEWTPERLYETFAGFVQFAPNEDSMAPTPDGQTAQTTWATQYEEQLEFLDYALGFQLDGTNVTDYAARRLLAHQNTERIITEMALADRDRRAAHGTREWTTRFNTLLFPPVDGWQGAPPAHLVPPLIPPTPPANQEQLPPQIPQ
jgi:type VI secretion system protein ImpL